MVEALAVRNLDATRAAQLFQKSISQCTLADARLPAQKHDLSPGGLRLLKAADELVELGFPPDQPRRLHGEHRCAAVGPISE